MERYGIKGRLRYTGEPAEKVSGSKPIHAEKGYYDGLAAILSFHPFYMLPLCNTVRWDTHCGAAYSMIYRFICDEPENWGPYLAMILIKIYDFEVICDFAEREDPSFISFFKGK